MKAKKREKPPAEKETSPYEEIKKDLEKQREALLAEVGQVLGSSLQQPSEALTDLGDQASAEAEQNFNLRLREREQRLLKKIDEAIDRINDGTFGICESCGNPISAKRLKARPVTTLCIDCKTKQEEEEKMRG
ncbi:MAG: RNA polymerase-binding protein DksA [Candidatus Manganitrophaceae bacterium]